MRGERLAEEVLNGASQDQPAAIAALSSHPAHDINATLQILLPASNRETAQVDGQRGNTGKLEQDQSIQNRQ